uniref:Cytochrome P450 71D8 n=1 Tax=Aegilops tauschii TaxID=37682 RepID=M8AH66_AEGTA
MQGPAHADGGRHGKPELPPPGDQGDAAPARAGAVPAAAAVPGAVRGTGHTGCAAGGAPMDFKAGDFEFIPFGAGRRMCPGMALGLANMELVLAGLLYHFDWEVPGGGRPEELDMSEACGITVQRKSKLVLHATQRIPLAD